jgi:ketosteroid isomerase-like protein
MTESGDLPPLPLATWEDARMFQSLFVSRRAVAGQVAATLAAALALTLLVAPPIVSRADAAEMTAAEGDAAGLAANQAWWGALVAGTAEAVGAVLAPEFQIMRADGSSYDKAGYLAGGLPKVAAVPEFSQMVVTSHGDLMITRYWVTVAEVRDGRAVAAHAPRLTVFRKENDTWLVSAHANFAALEK